MESFSTEQYYAMLDNVEEQIQFMDAASAQELVDKIFEVKPVRLRWYILKAKVMLKENRSIKDIIQFLSDKCEPWYPYDDVEEYLAFLSILAELQGDMTESRRYLYRLNRIQETFKDIRGGNKDIEEQLKNTVKEVQAEGEFQLSTLNRLIELYYISGNEYLYMLWQIAANHLFPDEKKEIRESVLQKENVGYYHERLINDGNEVFAVIVNDNRDEEHCLLAERALRVLDKEVFLLRKPENVEENENGAQFFKEQLEKIIQNNTKDGLITVLAGGVLIDQLAMEDELRSGLERLTAAESDYEDENIAVARYGDYLTYISKIYKASSQEIREELYKKPTCRFSVIIPCRNAGDTLYYTLKTCLNQSYQGEYEIIVSDNSDAGMGMETPTYKLCQKMQDDRIKYYRTPRNLSLAKSYEYPYLKAEGEFLLSLGADDGMLPWCLEELDGVLNKYPEQNIFLWHEISYQWPGTKGNFIGKQEEATLIVNERYEKGSPHVYKYSTEPIVKECFYSYGKMYLLPQLYHNSGIRREYMAALYKHTGRLWGGINQDISMAATIGNIEKELYFIYNPLVVNGVSSSSIGSLENAGTVKLDQKSVQEKYKSTFNYGYRVPGYVERLCPPLGSYYSNLYPCIMYAYATGAVPENIIEEADWRNIYEKSVTGLEKWDVLCDKKLHRLRYAVSLHGEELLEWFDENFYYEKLKPVIYKHEDMQKPDICGLRKANVKICGEQMTVEESRICDVYQVSLYLEDLCK